VTVAVHPEVPADQALESLRERKKAKTRRALVDAAVELFLEHGFERTTVEQIAEACEVSPRTFFRYFATKEDVLFADASERLDAFIAALEARPADESPLRSLRAASLTLVDRYEGQREHRKALAEIVAATPSLRARGSERQDNWNDAAVQLLTQRQPRTRRAASPLDIRLVVAAAMAGTRAALQAWLDEPKADLGALIAEVFDRLAAGLDD
jgi:AcrR family transcriptional regulator